MKAPVSGLVPYLTRVQPYQTNGHLLHLDSIPPSPFLKHSAHVFGDDNDDDVDYEKFAREVKKDVNNAVVDYYNQWIMSNVG